MSKQERDRLRKEVNRVLSGEYYSTLDVWKQMLVAIDHIDALEGQLMAAERAIGGHYPPNDCYATGPATGDPYKDLVECPVCVFLEMRKAALTQAEEKGGE